MKITASFRVAQVWSGDQSVDKVLDRSDSAPTKQSIPAGIA
jgi:hypothetical protein